MKNSTILKRSIFCSLYLILFLIPSELFSQQENKPSLALPDNINKIVTNSCSPCHTVTGGMLSKSKLNLTNWVEYSPEKQKEKAEKILSVLEKGKMPPKQVRENRPDIIPTKEQIDLIRKWAGTFNTEKK